MAKYKDNDTLNMQGNWEMIISTVIQDNVVKGASGTQTYELHFDNDGPGKHGGMKFKGQYIIRPEWKYYYRGETYYDHRGRFLIQMTGRLAAEQNYELMVGSHQADERGRTVIFGSWCGTGVSSDAPNQGGNTMGNFKLTKLPPPPPIKKKK